MFLTRHGNNFCVRLHALGEFARRDADFIFGNACSSVVMDTRTGLTKQHLMR